MYQRKSIKEQKLLYHLTSLKNIESILKDGLKARSSLINFQDVGEPNIIEFRNQNSISDLIPFHFFKGSPFAGKVQQNNPNEEFIYIVLHREKAKFLRFQVFPTHPKHMKPLQLLEYEEGIKQINWELMDKRDYSDYECKEVCMAECVTQIHSISPKFFQSIIVKSEETKKYIENFCNRFFDKKCEFYIDIEPRAFLDIQL